MTLGNSGSALVSMIGREGHRAMTYHATVFPRGMRVSSTNASRQSMQVRCDHVRELVDGIVVHLLRHLGGRRLRELQDELADSAAAPGIEDRDDCRRWDHRHLPIADVEVAMGAFDEHDRS